MNHTIINAAHNMLLILIGMPLISSCGGPTYLYPTAESQEIRKLCKNFYTNPNIAAKHMLKGQQLEYLKLESDAITYYFDHNRSFTVARQEATNLATGTYRCQ